MYEEKYLPPFQVTAVPGVPQLKLECTGCGWCEIVQTMHQLEDLLAVEEIHQMTTHAEEQQ